MAFLSPAPPFELSDAAWPIRTYQGQYPPTFIDKSSLGNSIISPGCRISGASVRNSILSPGVQIGRQTEVLDSIVFEGVQIGKNVRLKKVIVDKNSIVPDDFVIGYDEQQDGRYFKLYGEGIRIVPKNWRLE
jgi:glucose-1-phosphate adenylyltransferase